MINKVQNNAANVSQYRDYIIIFLQNKLIIGLIFLVSSLVAIIYSVSAIDFYKAEGTLRITKPKSDILSDPLLPEFQNIGTDRYIANEIEILKSISLSEIAASSIIDTFNSNKNQSNFYLLLENPRNKDLGIKTDRTLSRTLMSAIEFEQKRGLDIINLRCQSPSAYEATLIVNTYIDAYYKFNLQTNRNQLTLARTFLEEQKIYKLKDLEKSENLLKNFQESGNIVVLDDQAKSLVEQISQIEAQMNASEIETKSKQQSLSEMKKQISQLDIKIAKYIENLAVEPYIKALQEQIAKLEVQKELVNIGNQSLSKDKDPVFDNYNSSIQELQKKLNSKMKNYEAGLLVSTPTEIRGLSVEAIKYELEVIGSKTKQAELKTMLKEYENRFSKLPKQAIEFAKLERDRKSNEKLYVLIEEKYQEALIAEKSRPGNVQIIDPARIPTSPSKPNRTLIVIAGIVLGIAFGLGFIIFKKYFDVTIRTPEDIQAKGANVVGWIPRASDFYEEFGKEHEIIVESRPDSIPTESFLTIKMKLQFSKLSETPIKVALITSPSPKDGKTFIASNLAATYSMTGMKTLLMDLDLRRPRIHNIFKIERHPGLTDFLFGKSNLEQVIRKTFVKNLDMITAGTIPPNPAEIVSSEMIEKFINDMRQIYDFIVIDSPPIVAVADAGVISRMADATMLVVSTNQTRLDLMSEAINTITSIKSNFVGVLLNNFSMTNGYGYYYKYYHYYPKGGSEKKSSKSKVA